MGALWLVFTWSHGPTSFNENRLVLGRGMHFWGMLLGVVPNALVVAGMLGLRDRLLAGGGTAARVAFNVAIAALVASAAVDLIAGALGPPLLMPFLGAGLVIVGLAPGVRDRSRQRPDLRRPLLLIGILLLGASAFAWIPLEVSDAFGGYRIFGAVAHLAVGAAWTVVGLRAARPGAVGAV